MKKTIKAHEERDVKAKDASALPEGALPTYLLDREGQNDAKALSSAIKQKRKEKAGKFAVPLPKVRGIAEDEMFKVLKSGKTRRKGWKRMVTKATFVGEDFTRKPPKLERFIRPTALRYKKANVTHRASDLSFPFLFSLMLTLFSLIAELKATFQLPIIGVKKNPQSPMYTQLGVMTKGTVIEVNGSFLFLPALLVPIADIPCHSTVSELGLVTTGGKVVWGKVTTLFLLLPFFS
jgi:ribosome biogenesis protein NSA2